MPLLIILIFIVIAVQVTKVTFKQRQTADRLFKEGIRIQGLVMKLNTRIKSSIGTVSEYPVIRYTTADGKLIELEAKSELPVRYKGEKIFIYYDPENPEVFVQDSEPGSKIPYLVAGLMWLGVFVAIALYFISRN